MPGLPSGPRALSHAVAAALVAAVASYLAGLVAHVQQAAPSAQCRLLPLKAIIYVDTERGCGVGVAYVAVPGGQPCAWIEVDYVQIAGVARASPSPLVRDANVLEPGGTYYVVVTYDRFRGMHVFFATADPERVRRALTFYFARGYCIPGVEPGESYPGAIVWPPKVTYFTWETVASTEFQP